MTTRRFKSMQSYTDIEAVLRTILSNNKFPVRYELETPGQALNWRHRANAYRVALRRNEELHHDQPPGTGISPYDELILTIVPDDTCAVTIERRVPKGKLMIGGEEVDLSEIPFPPEVVRSALEDIDDD